MPYLSLRFLIQILALTFIFVSCSGSSSPSGFKTNNDFNTITISSGDGQFTALNNNFVQPISVQVTGDFIDDIPVRFEILSGSSPATLSATQVQTDASGFAQINVNSGPTAGTVSIKASLPFSNSKSSVVFNLYVNGTATDWEVVQVGGPAPVVAGVPFQVSIRALDTGLPDATFTGPKYLSFSTNAIASPNGNIPTPFVDGNYNFTNGVIDTPFTVTYYDSSENGGDLFDITVSGLGLNPGTLQMQIIDDAISQIKIVDGNNCATANEVTVQVLTAGTPENYYVLHYDQWGNCIEASTPTADWTKGFLDTQLTYDTSVTAASTITATPIIGGIQNTLSVIDSVTPALTDSTGLLQIAAATPSNFLITGFTAGGNFILDAGTTYEIIVEARDAFGNLAISYTGAQNLTFTSTATSTSPDPALGIGVNNRTMPTNGFYTFDNGGIVSAKPTITLVNASEAPTVSVTDGTLNGVTAPLAINPIAIAHTLVRDGANDTGVVFDATSATRTSDDSYNLYCANYDTYGNYISDGSANWTNTGVITAGEISPGLVGQTNITYAPSNIGAGTLSCNVSGFSDTTGTFNIVPGVPKYFKVDGGTGDDNAFTVTAGNLFSFDVNVYDADNHLCTNFNSTINTTISYIGSTAVTPAPPLEITPTYTSAQIDTTSTTSKVKVLTFSSGVSTVSSNRLINETSGDEPKIQIVDNGAIVSGTLSGNVNVGVNTLAFISIKNAAGGAGSYVNAPTTDNDTPLTFYAAGFDSSGNYIADQTVNWSVTAGTAACINGDLSSTNGTSTIFDPADAGTCTVNADAGAGITDTTGSISVSNGVVDHFLVEIPTGSPVTAGATFAVRITALDADNERVINYVPDTTYSLAHTDGSSPEGTPADVWTLLPGDFSFGQATLFGLKVYDASSTFTIDATETGIGSITGTSTNITVNPATLDHYGTLNLTGTTVADGSTTFGLDIEARDFWGNPTTVGTAGLINQLVAVYKSGSEAVVDTIGGFTPFVITGGNSKESITGLTYRVSHEVYFKATDVAAKTTPTAQSLFSTFTPDIAGLSSYEIDTFSTTSPIAGNSFTAVVYAKDFAGNTITGIDAALTAFPYTINSTATASEHSNAPSNPSFGSGALSFTNGVSAPITFTWYNDQVVLGSAITVNNGSGTTGDAGVNNITVGVDALDHYTNDVVAPASIDADGVDTFSADINARDQWGNIVTGAAAVTLSLTPTDGHTVGVLAGSTVLNLTSGSTSVSNLTYTAAGTGKLNATDGSVTMDLARSTNYTFGAVTSSLDHYRINLLDGFTVTAGDSTYTIQVTAEDVSNNTINDVSVDAALSGRVFTITGFNNSPEGDVPTVGTSLTFTNGVATIDVTPVKAESIATITVTDNLAFTGSESTGVTVSADAFDHIVISGATTGVADKTTVYNATITSRDQFGNPKLATGAPYNNLTLQTQKISGLTNTATLGGSITGIDLTASTSIIRAVTYGVSHTTRFKFSDPTATTKIDTGLTPFVAWSMDPSTVDHYTLTRVDATKVVGAATAYRLTAFDEANNQIVGEDTILNAKTFTVAVNNTSCDAPNGTADVVSSIFGSGASDTGTNYGGFSNGTLDIDIRFYNMTGCVAAGLLTVTDENAVNISNTDTVTVTAGAPAYFTAVATGFPANSNRIETAQTSTNILITQYDTYGNETLNGSVGNHASLFKISGYSTSNGTLKACSPSAGDGCAPGARQLISNISLDFRDFSQQTIYDLSYNVGDTIEIRINDGGITTESQNPESFSDDLKFNITPETMASYTFVAPAGPYTAGIAETFTLTAFDGASNQLGTAEAQTILDGMSFSVTQNNANEFDAPDGGNNFSFPLTSALGWDTNGQVTIDLTFYKDNDLDNTDLTLTDNQTTPINTYNSGGTQTIGQNVKDRFLVVATNLTSPNADALEKAASYVDITCVDEFGNPRVNPTSTTIQAVLISDGQTYGTNLGDLRLATTDGGGAVADNTITLNFTAVKTIRLYDVSYDVGHDIYIEASDGAITTAQTDSTAIEWVSTNDTIDHYILTAASGSAAAGAATVWTITAYDAANNTLSNENGINKGLLDALTYTISDNSGGSTMNGPEAGSVSFPSTATIVWATDGTHTLAGANRLTFFNTANDVVVNDLRITDSIGNTGFNDVDTMDIIPNGAGDHFHIAVNNLPGAADNVSITNSDITVTLEDQYGNLTNDAAVTAATISLNRIAGYAANGTMRAATTDGGGTASITGLTLNFSATDTVQLFDLSYDVVQTIEILVAHASVTNNTFAADSPDLIWTMNAGNVGSYTLVHDNASVNAGTSTTLTLTAVDRAGNTINNAAHQATLDTINFTHTTNATNDAPNATATVAANDPTNGTKTFASGQTTLTYTFFKEGTVATAHVLVTDTTNTIATNPSGTLTINQEVPNYFIATPTGFPANSDKTETPQTATQVSISQYDTYGNLTTGGSTGALASFTKTAGYGSTDGTLKVCGPTAGNACAMGARTTLASTILNFTTNDTQILHDFSYDVGNTLDIDVVDGAVTTASHASAANASISFNVTTGTVASYTFVSPAGPLTAGTPAAFSASAFDNVGNKIANNAAVLNSMQFTVTENTPGQFDAPDGGNNFAFNNQTLTFDAAGDESFNLTFYSDADFTDGDLTFSDNQGTPVTQTNTGGAVTLNPAVKAELHFVTQPSATATAGVNFVQQPTVKFTDIYGNDSVSTTDVVTLGSYTNAGCTIASGSALQGTTGVAAITGTSTFTDLNHTKMESIYLRASSAALVTDCSSVVAVDHNIATQLIITTQPSTGDADTTLSNIIATVYDAYNNINDNVTDTLTLSAYSNAACSVASLGTYNATNRNLSSGTATFNDVFYRKMENLYVEVTGGGYTADCSSVIAIDHGAATQLVVDTEPSAAVVAGVNLATQPIIGVQDAYGNVNNDVTDSITLSAFTDSGCTTTPSVGTFNATPTALSSGAVTFAGVNHEKMETIYIKATGGGYTAACTANVVVDHAAASDLVFSTQPSAAAVAGVAFATQPIVEVHDAFGNVNDNVTDLITLTAFTDATTCAAASGGTFNQTSRNLSGGNTGSFVSTHHEKMETIYLRASGGGYNAACSNNVVVDHAVGSQLVIATQPSAAAVAGVTLASQPVIELHDAFGNLANDSTPTITLSAYTDSGCTTTPSVGTFNHTPVAINGSGVATFTDVDHEKNETIYIKVDDGGALTDACTANVVVDHAAGSQLVVTTQPSAAVVAGVTLATQPVIELHDAFGNVANDVTPTITLSAYTDSGCTTTPSIGTFNHTPVAINGSGIATFTDVDHEKMETIYIKADDGGALSDACTANVVVDHANGSQLVYATAPSAAAVAGTTLAQQPVIELHDAFGNLANDATPTVTLTAFTDSGCTAASGGTFNHTPVAINGSGVSTFTDVDHEKMETIYIKADDGGALTDPCSSAVVVDHATASALFYTTQPSAAAVAGANLATQPTIEVRDAFGNVNDNVTDLITLSAFTDSGCTSASGGTFNQTAANLSTGSVTFANTNHETMETIYIRATGGGYTAACSTNVVVDHGTATQLVVDTQPSAAVVAGVNLATQPVIGVQDAYGNINDNVTDTITLSAFTDSGCTTTPSIGTFNATPTALSTGAVTFAGVNHQKMETIYIKATGGGYTAACTANVVVDHAAGSQLVYATSPSAAAVAGTTLAQQPVIELHDAFGNLANDATPTVTLTAFTDSGCTAASGGTFNHTPVAINGSGVSTFTDVDHEKMETIYIKADDGGALTDPCSSAVVVDHGTATQLVVNTQPSAAVLAGVNLATQPVIGVQDAYGNINDNVTDTITLSAFTDSGCTTTPSIGTFNATPTALSTGAVTFAGVNHQKMETIYIKATGGGYTAACTANVVVDHAAGSQLVYATSPSAAAVAGTTLAQQPVIELHDAFGNLANDATPTVTLTAFTDSGCTAASGGTFVHTPVAINGSGVATFTDVEHRKNENIYIKADDGGALTDACSSVSNIDHAAGSQLVIATQPSAAGTAGILLAQQPVIELHDAFGNVANDVTPTVTLSAFTDSGCTAASGGTFVHTPVAINGSGVATFTDVEHQKMETIYIKADDGGALTDPCTANVIVDHGAAADLVVNTQPSAAAVAGVAFATQPIIEVRDAYGNINDNVTDSITLSAFTDSGCTAASGGTFNQTSRNLSGGNTGSFVGTNHELMETIYIKASGGTYTDACTTNVVVDHAVAASLHFTTQPSGTATADNNFAQQPVVEVRDSFGNVNDNATDSITLTAFTDSGCTSASGGTFNSTPTALSSGNALFTGVNHRKKETIYIKATGSTYTTDCSTSVAVEHGAAGAVVITTDPVANETINKDFATQPVAQSEDAYGNLRDTDSATSITLTAFTDSSCTAPAAGSISGGSVTLASGIATFTNLQHDTAVGTYYVRASDGSNTDCSSISTQVYAALAITPTTPTLNTTDVQTFQITGGVPPITCNDLTTNNSQGSVTSSCYTAACGGDVCIDYTAGMFGNGVTDVINVTDNANSTNSQNSTITVNGPNLIESSAAYASHGPTVVDEPHSFTFQNNGNATANTISVSITGANAADFAIGGTDTCSTSNVIAAATCDIDIDFLAGTNTLGTGTYNATLTITGANGGEIVIPLVGNVP